MTDVMIEAHELTKQYGSVRALSDLSMQVRRGEVLGLLGPNGAGKTTTMKILTCYTAPTSGTAKVNGCDLFDDPLGVRDALGYLPETTPLYLDMIVLEYLAFVAELRGVARSELQGRLRRVVEETSLGDVYSKPIGVLSKGYRQRVGLAQALIHEPQILILDEPMSGLDPNQALEIRDLIKELGRERTIILSTHNLAEVQATCGRVLIIARGKLVADDTPDKLRDRAGKARYLVSVLRDSKADGPDAIRSKFAGISAVDRVREAAPANGELRFEVVPRGDDDLRPLLFRTAVDANYTLVELRREGQNLEQIFRELTLGDEPRGTSKPSQGAGA
ncbi:MAG: ABC transporter ATP-binding protein [Proteobacteria bacterium]|nr:ABC transporter ATP-binding protein [Pseudomonadota bacterium]